ncbi:MAG: hypothetical protein IRZ07_04725, partial [Microbispora sp.]|nr:hypothetical protein [Microbispora sp.]
MTGHLLGELVGLPGSSEDEITEIEREITGISDKLHIHCRSAIDKAFEQRDPDSRIESWQQFFIDLAKLRAVSAHRVWYLFVHHPGQIATSFRLRKSNDWPLRTLAEQYEAWYLLAVNKNVPYVVERDAADGAAYLARTRWRLLSAFFRPEFGSSGPEPDRLISPRQQKTVGQWAERARAAREQWLSVLSEIDSHPTLRDRIDCEAEAVLLASIEIDAKVHARVRSDSPTARQKDDRGDQARRNGPLGGQPSNALSADPDRRAIAGYVATQLLLPRFAWHRSWTVVRQLCGRRLLNHWIGTAALFTVALVTFTLTAAGVLDTWGYTTATAIALLGYGLIAVGAAL